MADEGRVLYVDKGSSGWSGPTTLFQNLEDTRQAEIKAKDTATTQSNLLQRLDVTNQYQKERDQAGHDFTLKLEGIHHQNLLAREEQRRMAEDLLTRRSQQELSDYTGQVAQGLAQQGHGASLSGLMDIQDGGELGPGYVPKPVAPGAATAYHQDVHSTLVDLAKENQAGLGMVRRREMEKRLGMATDVELDSARAHGQRILKIDPKNVQAQMLANLPNGVHDSKWVADSMVKASSSFDTYRERLALNSQRAQDNERLAELNGRIREKIAQIASKTKLDKKDMQEIDNARKLVNAQMAGAQKIISETTPIITDFTRSQTERELAQSRRDSALSQLQENRAFLDQLAEQSRKGLLKDGNPVAFNRQEQAKQIASSLLGTLPKNVQKKYAGGMDPVAALDKAAMDPDVPESTRKKLVETFRERYGAISR